METSVGPPMKFRFRQWGQDDWTYIEIKGDLDYIAGGVIGSGLSSNRNLHVQQQVDGDWETLGA